MQAEIKVAGSAPLRSGACRVIAEAGANHNNSVERAIEMAHRAADAGAWAIKYQLYKADSISVPESPKYWQDSIASSTQFEAFQLSDHLDYADYGRIAAGCREAGIAFFATPFDLLAVEELERIGAPLYKLASADITFKRLIEAVAETGKPMLLSTGASTREEIERAISWTGLGPDRLALLVCTLTYPTPDPDGHFARIEEFRDAFDPYLIGVSDHTLGAAGAWMTTALGGVCIEKHYTLDPGLPDVPDHAISATPEVLAEMVAACERGAVLRGEREIAVHPSELPARENARRSIVLERDLPSGHPLAARDLGCKRPGTGLPPFELEHLVGRRLQRELRRGDVLAMADLEPEPEKPQPDG